MKIRLLFVLILSTTFTDSNAQGTDCPPCNCSQLIRQFSVDWKNDSLANNGLRFNHHKKLLKCSVDKVSLDFLLTNFGKPFLITETNKGIEYLYLFYDEFPEKSKKNGHFIGSISFLFDDRSKMLLSIFEYDY